VISRYVFIYIYIYRFIFNSTVRNTVQSVWGTNTTVGQLYSEEKTESLCWLYDKYGNLVRNCRLRNYRLIIPSREVDRMYRLDRR